MNIYYLRLLIYIVFTFNKYFRVINCTLYAELRKNRTKEKPVSKFMFLFLFHLAKMLF